MRHTTLYTVHDWDESHLAVVMADMERMGAPTIRVCDCGDHYVALEGVHRIEAASRLGIAPALDILLADDFVVASSIDIDSIPADENGNVSVTDLVEYCYHPKSGVYAIDFGNGTLSLVSRSQA